MTKLIIQLCLWETLACSYSIISKFNFYDDHHISFQTYITFIWTHYLFKPAPIAQDTGWGEGNISSPKGEIILKRLSWPMDHKWTLQQHSSHIHSHTLMYTKHLQAHTDLSSQIDAKGRWERERAREWRGESSWDHWCTLGEACVGLKLLWGGGSACLPAWHWVKHVRTVMSMMQMMWMMRGKLCIAFIIF